MAQHTFEARDDAHLDDDLERTVTLGLPAGWTGTYLRSVGSTQDIARSAALEGASDRRIVVADEQTAGRGRQGHSWLARPGTSLMVSIIFREQAAVPQPLRFTMLASVALAEAVKLVGAPCRPRIKWPNDLIFGGKKAAGVLAESFSNAGGHVVIVGCGLNVNEDPVYLAAVSPTATSVSAQCGRFVSRSGILESFLPRLDALSLGNPSALRSAWERLLWGVGQTVRLRGIGEQPDLETRAVVQGIEPDGRLRVLLPNGQVVRSATAEIIL